MVWFRKSKQRAEEVSADIADAKSARDSIIEQRSMLSRGLELLDERRKMNGFGDELQITFSPRREGDYTPKPRHA